MHRGLLQDESTGKNESLLSGIRKRPFYFLIVLLLLINISLIATNTGLWIIAAYQKLFVRADFTSFYTGYYMVRVGEGENLYDSALQSEYQQQWMGGLTFEGGVLLFPNPPFVAILFSPISFLSLDAAFYLWSLIQLGLLIWLLISLGRLFSHWNRHERIMLITSVLAFWPLANTFLLGQFSLFLVIGLLQMYIGMQNSRLNQAGLWLILLAIKPHTLLIPGMMTLNKRFWRVTISTAIAGMFIFIGSCLIIGIRPWQQYIQSLQNLGSYFGKYGVHPNTEYTFRGVLSNFLGNSQGNLINIISSSILLIGMISVWLIWRTKPSPDRSRISLYFAFAIQLSVFLSLHLNPHDSLLLVLPAVLFYDYLRQNDYPRKAFSILVLLSPSVFFISAFNDFNVFGVIRPPVVVILLILAWMIRYLIIEYRLQDPKQIPIFTPTNTT